ncbi:RMD1 family protein [Arenibacter sp. 6A1]|uniref:RMD1 family protein n=1 Tax=Arenibacter sp. 6A1 TaxID=2720391 RepID=UPI001447682B|nr:RMD1 family protein [Arenibacter sp. 6A1]NKI25423.1 RMD1 family protein [Arenibacter sp. 6A1]
MYKVVAFHIASSLNIRQCKSLLPLEILYSDSEELYLKNGDKKFVYIFQYGLVSFFNHSEKEMQRILYSLRELSKEGGSPQLTETMQVEIIEGHQEVAFDKVVLPNFDSDFIRLVMLNTSHSVALDRYSLISEELLGETNEHTKYLEQHGRLNISGIKLKRFIGKVLNIKNQITENLYIFDEPDSTWENESLNKLNVALKQTFDLKNRYRNIHERIEIIKENLGLFKDILDHRESSRLEWIIIILILVEVLDLFVLRLIR